MHYWSRRKLVEKQNATHCSKMTNMSFRWNALYHRLFRFTEGFDLIGGLIGTCGQPWPFVLRAARACLQRVADWGSPAHVGEMRRLDVTDAQWQRLEPLLPPEKPRTGRPNHDHRRVVSGMLWIHRTGAPWRDLPERYGPVGTVSSRFYRWCRAGVWDRILCALQAEADARGEIDWDLHFVDATIVRAHQHAAGARRTGAVGG